MEKRKIRIFADIAMTVLLPMLMAYSLIGEKFHEIVGSLMFALFILHHVLNRKWYGSIFKGKYNPRRTFQTVLDVLLIIFMLAQPISGIMMSKHLYTFIQIPGVSATAREVHMCLAYWGFVLLSVHAGMHLTAPIRKLFMKSKSISVGLCAGLTCISAYGIAAFIKRGFPGYMSGRTMFAFFDYSEPKVFFFLDHLAIMILFMMTGCLVIYGLGKTGTKRKAEKK